MNENILLECKNVARYFETPKGPLHAVDNISFQLKKGTTLGLVGESGCGKSTLGRTILRLTEATAGEILYDGVDIRKLTKKEMRLQRRKMQMIFQDPFSSLNPKMTVGQLIEEPLLIHRIYNSKEERNRRVNDLMDIVGLANRYINSYPHELDGGRRQRIGIARALALNPEFIVCDEPVSALDVSIQAQILNLLIDLKEKLGLTYVFVTHDLSVVKHISDNIMVMYLGKMVEMAPAEELFRSPRHPYTQALLQSIPIPDISYKGKEFHTLEGEVVSPINPVPGCRFAARCPYATELCHTKMPNKVRIGKEHIVTCHLYSKEFPISSQDN